MKKVFATLVISALIATPARTHAQSLNHESYKVPQHFLSNFFDREPPDCRMFYPEPIGTIPSRTGTNELCLPPPIAIIPKYGKNYARLMRNAIQAGIKGDYNTALINFRRAHLIEMSQGHLGYKNREALRGIHGAMVAKRYQIEPHPVKRLTPQFFWYHWTGTGDRGSWGKIPYE